MTLKIKMAFSSFSEVGFEKFFDSHLEPGWELNNYLGKLYCVSIL